MAERKSDNADLIDERITSLFPSSKSTDASVENGIEPVFWWLNNRRRCHKHTITKRNAIRRKVRH